MVNLSSGVLLLDLATLGGFGGHASVPEGELSLQTSLRRVHRTRGRSRTGARLQAGF